MFPFNRVEKTWKHPCFGTLVCFSWTHYSCSQNLTSKRHKLVMMQWCIQNHEFKLFWYVFLIHLIFASLLPTLASEQIFAKRSKLVLRFYILKVFPSAAFYSISQKCAEIEKDWNRIWHHSFESTRIFIHASRKDWMVRKQT